MEGLLRDEQIRQIIGFQDSLRGIKFDKDIVDSLGDAVQLEVKKSLASAMIAREFVLELDAQSLSRLPASAYHSIVDAHQFATVAANTFSFGKSAQHLGSFGQQELERLRKHEARIADRLPILQVALHEARFKAICKDRVENDLAGMRKSAESGYSELLDETESKLKSLVSDIKVIKTQIRIEGEAALFGSEAISHGKLAGLWIFLALCFGGGTMTFLCFSFRFLIHSLPDASTGVLTAFTLTKTLVASILVAGIAYCASIAKSHLHNRELNRFRHNALTIFFDVIAKHREGMLDDEIRVELMRQAVACIFAHQSTGFSHSDGDSAPLNSVINRVSGKSD